MIYKAIDKEKKIQLVIEDAGKGMGYYLYVFNLNTNTSIADHLCDDLQQAFYVAKEDYGISDIQFKKY